MCGDDCRLKSVFQRQCGRILSGVSYGADGFAGGRFRTTLRGRIRTLFSMTVLFNASNIRNTHKLHQRNRRRRFQRLLIQSLQEGGMG